MAKPKIVIGQRPTYMPSSSFPVNQRYIEYKKLKKAKKSG
jgi:hypothetical protein